MKAQTLAADWHGPPSDLILAAEDQDIDEVQPAQQDSTTAGASTPATLPASLKPFEAFSEQAARYHALINLKAWQSVYRADFAKSAHPTWEARDGQSPTTPNPQPPGDRIKTVREDGHDCIRMESQPNDSNFIAFGPRVHGDFFLEIVAKLTGPRICDLSLVCDNFSLGPAFQFGGHNNEQNLLWMPARSDPALPPRYVPQQVSNEVRIKPDTWHRVGLEIRHGKISAFVDGEPAGSFDVPQGAYDPQRRMQPMIYTYGSHIVVQEASIETDALDLPHIDKAKAWTDAFGKRTRVAVDGDIERVIALLADDNPAVRDAAERMLIKMGDTALEKIERSTASQVPELAARARKIVHVMKPN